MQVWDIIPDVAPGVLPSASEYDYASHGFLPSFADMAGGKKAAKHIFKHFAEWSVGADRDRTGLFTLLLEHSIDPGAWVWDLLVVENPGNPELRRALPGEITCSGKTMKRGTRRYP